MSCLDTDDAIALLVVHLCRKRKREREKKKEMEKAKKKKRIWVKGIESKENQRSQTLLAKQLTDPDDSKNFLRMNSKTYMELLDMVSHLIRKEDSHMRDAISPNERLSATLRFLTSGQSYENLKFSTNISAQCLGLIIIETCEALVSTLKSYIQVPEDEEEWKMLADEFDNEWNFSNSIGAIGGKHIHIVKPKDSANNYYCYKKRFSLVMMAVVNASYEFISVEVGASGEFPEEGVFGKSELKQQIDGKNLNLPEPDEFPLSEEVVPYVLLGDEAFPLLENLMKPYSRYNLNAKEKTFNYRFSRAQHIIQNTFDILANRFRILLTIIHLCPKKAAIITLACCYLHNYMMKNNPSVYLRSVNDINENKHLTDLEPLKGGNGSVKAKRIRAKFCNYFNSEGALAWQHKFE